jgi:hypothetical protein
MLLDILFTVVALFAGGILFYAALTRFTTLAAIVQMGSIQERSMPWADQSKRDPAKRNKEPAVAAARAAAGEPLTPSTPATPSKSKDKKAPITPAKAIVAPAETLSSALSTGVTKVADVAASGASAVLNRVVDSQSKDALDRIKLHDQITYTLSLINMMITAYLLGTAPQYFYLWHTPKAIGYTAHRWYTFKKQNQHYLMYDFCYWANALSILYVWFCPENEVMFQILFMVSNGPLAWAVLAFSQSLIFHSAPHMTSVFIHTSPMLLTYALRWNQTPFKVCSNFPECSDENTGPLTMLYNAHSKFYLWWVIIYYVWVYLIMSRRIKDRGYKTLFDRVSSRGPTKFLTKVSQNDLVQKAAYMVVHVAFATFTMVLATAYWRSQIAHFVFIMMILATSAWNASGFYFTVFANKYAEDARDRATK